MVCGNDDKVGELRKIFLLLAALTGNELFWEQNLCDVKIQVSVYFVDKKF